METSNGTIAVTAPRGQLSLVSSNARIGIAATDAAVRASSANGEIAFAGSLATGPQSFGTSNAAIALHLGADATFSLDLETSNAKVAVGYPVTTSETASETRLAGRVGVAPAIAISARTSNGGVTILPAKEGLEGNRLASSELYRLRFRAPPTADVALALLATTGALTLAGWAVFRFLERRARERGLLDQAAGS